MPELCALHYSTQSAWKTLTAKKADENIVSDGFESSEFAGSWNELPHAKDNRLLLLSVW